MSEQNHQHDEHSSQIVDQLKAVRATLKSERAKLKTERAKMTAAQSPHNSEQASKKDNNRLFGLLEKTLMFLATLAIPIGAYLWTDRYSMPDKDWLVVASFFIVILIAIAVLFVALIMMSLSSRG